MDLKLQRVPNTDHKQKLVYIDQRIAGKQNISHTH